jgi:hypothetical protein
MLKVLKIFVWAKPHEDEEDKEEEEAITQKPTCNEAFEHLNALWWSVESISEVPQQMWKAIWDM